ncbi:hypothetical protein HYH03_013579 [Edaphochlamys debaryana]|uniref:Protein kinase domain-containing protein n=1 Tax=Edaphochlamys debaryana TaxID=47281 RepID=A0A835XY87_9CHLO|nr:hypothetical protein HYH03_013579 [Edaphochlamys debaryana]|eukprot:KAG2487864.1 hypothetical protein HYH03_013579 [Edaphochlamys debaryana]
MLHILGFVSGERSDQRHQLFGHALLLVLAATNAAAVGNGSVVNTALELANALSEAGNGFGGEIIISADIRLVDLAFRGVQLLIILRSPLLIRRSQAAPESWPVLDLNSKEVRNKAPGFELLLPSLPEDWGGSYVVQRDMAIVHRACFSGSVAQASLGTVPRPQNAAYPNASFITDVANPSDCVPMPAEDGGEVVVGTGVPAVRRCFASRGQYVSMVAYGLQLDEASGKAVRTGYDMLALNETFLCLKRMSTECLSELGPLGCYKSVTSGNGRPPPPGGVVDGLLPVAGPSGETQGSVVGVVVGAVLGAQQADPGCATGAHGAVSGTCPAAADAPSSADDAGGKETVASELEPPTPAWPGEAATCTEPEVETVPVTALTPFAPGLVLGLVVRREAGPAAAEGQAVLGASPLAAAGASLQPPAGAAAAPPRGGAAAAAREAAAAGPVRPPRSARDIGAGTAAELLATGDILGALADVLDMAAPPSQAFTWAPEGAAEPAPPAAGDAAIGSGGHEGDGHAGGGPAGRDGPGWEGGASASGAAAAPTAAGEDAEAPLAVVLTRVTLGKGTYGKVMEGLYGGRKVAVKLIAHPLLPLAGLDGGGGSTGLLPEWWQLKAFQQEVEVLGRCCHPNIVSLLAANLRPPRICLVLELMETSLDRLLAKHHHHAGALLPMSAALAIAIDIAKGLAFLHPTITHRDLKPGNILINYPDSDSPTAKLTDFGLARLRSTFASTENPEVGTPPYMAPEVFDVENFVVTDRADIYAFGVILWQMLSGAVPWQGLNMMNIARAVTLGKARLPIHGVLEGAGSVAGGSRCSSRLKTLMRGCWEEDPQRRPAAAEVAVELALVREGLAPPPAPGDPAPHQDRPQGVEGGLCDEPPVTPAAPPTATPPGPDQWHTLAAVEVKLGNAATPNP